MADETPKSTPEQPDKERIAEAKAHAASRVKEEMAQKTRDLGPSSDAALRFQKQKEGRKSPLSMEERAKVLADRALTIAPRSSILEMLSS